MRQGGVLLPRIHPSHRDATAPEEDRRLPGPSDDQDGGSEQ